MPRILIVDDEKANRDALARALGDENPSWTILTAANESESLTTLESAIASNQPIDVLLTDLVMTEEQSGMTMLRQAKRLDPSLMAILFTAKETSLDRYAAFAQGAFEVVEKNIIGTAAVKELNVKTRTALRYRESLARIGFLRRYFDPKVFETIERDPDILTLSEKLVTICFWDIRGFSKLCMILRAHPRLIADFLKDYCEAAAKIIFEYGGVLDKFIGDGVMALFGVLNHKGDDGSLDAVAAVRAAMDLRLEFERVLEKWMREWERVVPERIEIGLGCGIHTGEALVGNVGTDFRDQFTALGPNVNLTARIEGMAKVGQILISRPTEVRVKQRVRVTAAGEVSDIKNIGGSFALFSV